jgi:hypothetical protein
MNDIKFILLWCGVMKVPETLSMALGHLWQDFCLIPKISKNGKSNQSRTFG